MSFSTPTKPKKVPCKNRKNMNNHAFSIQEIDDAFKNHGQCVLFGSAAVWLYAEYYGVPHVGLSGVGSDIDLLDPGVIDTYHDTLVSENGMQCRHIDLVSIDRVGAKSSNDLHRMSNVLQFSECLITVIGIRALITAYDTVRSNIIEWKVGRKTDGTEFYEESTVDEAKKIEFKLKILQDVQAIMSTQPAVGGDAPAHFKF